MSAFPNWLQGLQGLFGQGGQQGQQAHTGGFTHPGSHPSIPGQFSYAGPGTSQAFGGPGGHTVPLGLESSQYEPRYFSGQTGMRITPGAPSQQAGGGFPTYGQLIAGGLAQDRARSEAARQQELGLLQGLFGQLQGQRQGFGQMVQQAQGAQQQGMDLMFQQAQNVNRAGEQGQQFVQQAQQQAQRGLQEAQRQMQGGVDTMRRAISDMDFFRKDTVASGVMGVQQQFRTQMDAINRRDDLTPEQKGMMQDELRMGMQRESASLASQADQQAAQALAQMQSNLASLESTLGAQWGSLTTQTAQGMGALGLQSAAMQQQAQEQIGQWYSGMHQFSQSALQSAMATALDMEMRGNALGAQLVQSFPLGPVSIAEMLTRQVMALEADRSAQVDPRIMALFA
jgi:hypothetical protein